MHKKREGRLLKKGNDEQFAEALYNFCYKNNCNRTALKPGPSLAHVAE